MVSHRSVLIVEDNAAEQQAMSRLLRMEGYKVFAASHPDEAMQMVNQDIGLVVSDLCMGAKGGLDLLRMWKREKPKTPFILVTAHCEVQSAVDAMKGGANDYLIKPIDPRELMALVAKHCSETEGSAETSFAKCKSGQLEQTTRLIGKSIAMKRIREQIVRASRSDSTVTIQGESGTGKELVAQGIHDLGNRCNGPFVAVNMAAVPESLVESELFGHLRGSFTGAAADREGRFAQAHGGTLFIDEIGDFPLSSQAKLLRALETRLITPVGGNEARVVDVRVIAATSRDLIKLLNEKRFREDLYYRLQVITIALPPLRNRREDIVPIAEYILDDLAQRLHRPRPILSDELKIFFEAFDWPGNVRQLRNCLESMLVLHEGSFLTTAHLPTNITPTNVKLDEISKIAIIKSLDRHGGDRIKAAECLGISVRTLHRRLKEWGSQVPPGQSAR